MNLSERRVLIIGGGIAGLSAAEALLRTGVPVDLVERDHFPGGKAVRFACKAGDGCVKCGACMVEEKLATVLSHPGLTLHRNAEVTGVRREGRFNVTLAKGAEPIDPEKCVDCGTCYEKCRSGAVLRGHSAAHRPFYAIATERCGPPETASCALCADACPEGAIAPAKGPTTLTLKADAVILATGYAPFDPSDTPYGYGHFPNVITTLELERMLRDGSAVALPAGGVPPEKIAFFQCVGSRDARLGHLWCSKTCCPSALRMARLIRKRRPETEIAFFYMDIQSFGKGFEGWLREAEDEIRTIRAIPGEVVGAEGDRLQVSWYDPEAGGGMEEAFDLVALSIGQAPEPDFPALAALFSLMPAESGYAEPETVGAGALPDGVFTAGTVRGPMNIPEAVACAEGRAWEVLRYLEG